MTVRQAIFLQRRKLKKEVVNKMKIKSAPGIHVVPPFMIKEGGMEVI